MSLKSGEKEISEDEKKKRVFGYQKTWCAPCTLKYIQDLDLHTFCVEKALMKRFSTQYPSGDVDPSGEKRARLPRGLAFLEALFDHLKAAGEAVAPATYLDSENNPKEVKKNKKDQWRLELDQEIKEVFDDWWKRQTSETLEGANHG